MNFSKNLSYARKKLGISQEDFAEKLNVTRQSVSKWENNDTFPDIDKLSIMCKIFNVKLDDLVNGDLEHLKDEDKSYKVVINEVLNGIKKIVSDLGQKDAKGIIKFIVEIAVILLIIFAVNIPFVMIENFINEIFMTLGIVGGVISSVLVVILQLTYFLVAVVMFIYIIKLRYIDGKELKENVVKEKEIKENTDISSDVIEAKVEKKKREYREPFKIVSILSGLILLFLKFVFSIMFLCLIFIMFFIVVGFSLFLILSFKGVIFFGVLIAFLGGLLLIYSLEDVIFKFVFNKRNNALKVFILLLVSTVLLGVGVGSSIYEFSQIEYNDTMPNDFKVSTKSSVIPRNDSLKLDNFHNVKYVVENRNDIKLTYQYYEELSSYDINVLDNVIFIDYNNTVVNPKVVLDSIIKNLKNKKLYNYDSSYFNLTVYATQSDIDKLIENTNNFHN
ncbi:MAG: helix-turn-helix domain-containing protein [Bacilli bacterium]